ncbi:hypothetical protein C8Q76DRAFT_795998 [Earliella scabrosa]|nr:hypothetical protein C8Q76DRAFT_795998 [Earliella scabrosa]
MIEPDIPVTIRVRHVAFPAFLLPSDDDVKFKPSSAFLRYRHLRQSQRVIRNFVYEPVLGAPGQGQSRTTPGVPVDLLNNEGEDGPATEKSTVPRHRVSRKPHPARQATPDRLGELVSSNPSPRTTTTFNKASTSAQSTRSATPDRSSGAPSPLNFTPGPSSLVSTSGSDDPVVKRCSHRIRKSTEYTVWYASTGRDTLNAPPSIPCSRYGELYVHAVADGAVQVWLRTATSEWQSIDILHPHPYLSGYVLHILPNCEPRWVTKDTVRTYAGRAKKRARELSHTPFDED